MTKWFKHTFVCDNGECDALYEINSKESMVPACFEPECQVCGCKVMNTVSVVDVTVSPINQPEQKEVEMTTMTDSYRQELELTYGNEITELKNQLANHSNCDYWKSENGRIGSQLIDLVNAFYEDEQNNYEIINDICTIIDYQPKKEIEFEGTITFRGRVDIDMATYKEGFDLNDYISDLAVDVYNSDVVIDHYELDNVEEC